VCLTAVTTTIIHLHSKKCRNYDQQSSVQNPACHTDFSADFSLSHRVQCRKSSLLHRVQCRVQPVAQSSVQDPACRTDFSADSSLSQDRQN